MAVGNSVVVCSPNGRKIEGIISGSGLKPGIMMQIKSGTEPVGGRHTWEVYAPSAGGDGAPALIAILDVDYYQGKTTDDAYTTGSRCFLWVPGQVGDEFNLRKANISGTGSGLEDLTIGERLLVVSGTGMISPVAVGVVASPVAYPFQALETLTDQSAEQLVHCIYTGV